MLLLGPLHIVQRDVCVCVCEEMVLAVVCVSGCPLAELSSLPGTGYTPQLQGNHSAGKLRFHLSAIHSGTYLEQLICCACHEPQERSKALSVRGGEGEVKVVWQGPTYTVTSIEV